MSREPWKMSIMKPMKDKNRKGPVQNVLHKADEGQNRKGRVENVLHKADEGQN
ncbi:hypothetical protein [Bacillus salipaludis]|uniref:Uncharacterized protein n=1 Tax=Bacillus salipaludis TaxID=2547811 RepID=A0AA90R6H8_9BACI|nr:hypothetical protein [Bacillus salipaludis]MDQ6596703.1 hypothetical protein [Bacillus salipaludis]